MSCAANKRSLCYPPTFPYQGTPEDKGHCMSKERADRLKFVAEPPLPKKPQARRGTPASASSSARPRRRYQRRSVNETKRLRMLREVLETITLTILMFMAFRFAVQNYRVDGHSMLPTFQD